MRSDQQNRSFAQQAAARLVVQRNASKFAAHDIGNSVVFREALVYESVVGVQQVQSATVLVNHAFKKEFRLLTKGLAKIVVKVGEGCVVGNDASQVTEQQPLPGRPEIPTPWERVT